MSHDAQRGMFDLHARGELPASFARLQEMAMKEQEVEGGAEADVDIMFDVPLLLAKEFTGFKHDEEPECFDGEAPVAFEDGRSRKRRWWKPW